MTTSRSNRAIVSAALQDHDLRWQNRMQGAALRGLGIGFLIGLFIGLALGLGLA